MAHFLLDELKASPGTDLFS